MRRRAAWTVVPALALGLALAGRAAAAPIKADFNADGLEDLVVGLPGKTVDGADDAGAIALFYGRPIGIAAAPQTVLHRDSRGVGGVAEAGHRFGHAVAVGDFDGDGFDDLAVGTPNETVSGVRTGEVNVLHGSAAGLHEGAARSREETILFDVLDTPAIRGSRDVQIGHALAAGDFDCDGYDDLAIGAPGSDVNRGRQVVKDAGAVLVVFGSARGVRPPRRTRLLSQGSFGVPRTATRNGRFGHTLLAGDFDRDGCDDLVVGSPFERVDGKAAAGAVTLLHGRADGLLPGNTSYVVDALASGGIELGDRFGETLAAGDVNGDGHLDLAVGHPRETRVENTEGWVTVLLGSSIGITNASPRDFWHQGRRDVPGEPEIADFFGAALAAADLDGDGFADLAMGVPYESFERFPVRGVFSAGRVVVAYGSSRGLRTRAGVSDWDRDSVGVASPRGEYDYFGAALGVGDFNRDGVADLIVGVPGEDVTMTSGVVHQDAGVAQILYGAPQGLSALPELGRQMVGGGRDPAPPIHTLPGDGFGARFAP